MLVDGELCLSYGQAIERVEALAQWLVLQGVGPGDRVAMQLRKSVNEILLVYAVARVRAVFVNVHPLWSELQLQHVLESCGARLVLVESHRVQALSEWGGATGLKVFAAAALDGVQGNGQGGDPVRLPPAADAPDALATIIYTSGSTGRPKGVMHSQRNLVAFGANVASYLNNTAADRVLSVLPLSFGYGLSQLLTVVQAGACLVLEKSALAADVLEAMQQHAITGLGAVPSMWRQLIEVQKQRCLALPHLRYVTNAGDAPGAQLVDDMGMCFAGVDLVLMYGTTETLRSAYLPPAQLKAKKGAIGQAVPGVQLYVLTQDGRLGGPGERGELLHGGAHMMLGYWNDAQATAHKLQHFPQLAGADTVLCRTEDMVSMDADGCLWFEGRAQWMIKRNGFRLSLAEVEEWIGKLAVVQACVALLVRDDNPVDAIHLVVIAMPGGLDNAQDLFKVLRRRLPGYLLPSSVSFWPEAAFPYTANGKLDRLRIEMSAQQSNC